MTDTVVTEYGYGYPDAPDTISVLGQDEDDLGSALYYAEEFWGCSPLRRTVTYGPWEIVDVKEI